MGSPSGMGKSHGQSTSNSESGLPLGAAHHSDALLQGADGTYGTSLAYGTAMDPSCDVMVAYKQNDRFLAPDHGFPIRMIIPGHIGESSYAPITALSQPLLMDYGFWCIVWDIRMSHFGPLRLVVDMQAGSNALLMRLLHIGQAGCISHKCITWHAGGRMVKWLSEISVAPDESQNFYHFHDNRVLPPGVDQEKAKAEGQCLLKCWNCLSVCLVWAVASMGLAADAYQGA